MNRTWRLRAAIKKARPTTGEHAVFTFLLDRADQDSAIIADGNQPTRREMAEWCSMPAVTLTRVLNKLKDCGWVRVVRGVPNRYELDFGDALHPERKSAMTDAERSQAYRARRRKAAEADAESVTINESSTQGQSVEASRTGVPSAQGQSVAAFSLSSLIFRDGPPGQAGFSPVVGVNANHKPTDVPASASSREEPSQPGFAFGDQGAALDPPGDADPLDPGRASRRRDADQETDLENTCPVIPQAAGFAAEDSTGLGRGGSGGEGHDSPPATRPAVTGKDHPEHAVTEVEGGKPKSGLGARTTETQRRRICQLLDRGWAPWRIGREPDLPSEMVIYAIRRQYWQEQASEQQQEQR